MIVRKKKSLTFVFRQGLWMPDGAYYVVEFKSIAGALEAHGRGAKLPYFGKQSNIMLYSPREQKRKTIEGLPGVSDR